VFFVGIVTFLLMLFGMHKSIKFVLDPIIQVIKVTEKISEGDLSHRVHSQARDLAVVKLVGAVNTMTDKLEYTQKKNIALEAQREEYLAAISHDLKTPITAINMNIGALKDGLATTPERAEKYFNNILRKTNDINNMIKELTVISNLEVGKATYEFEAVQLDWFVNDVLDEALYSYNDKIETIEFENTLEERYLKSIDVSKFRRYINNILANSIKYSGSENLRITVRLEHVKDVHRGSDYPNRKKVRLTIEDNGLGVESQELDQLFDKFYRVDVSRNQNVAGSGLGLAICKSIIENHKGSLYAESEKGSYFRVVAEF